MALQERFAGRGLALVGIDLGEDADTVRRFAGRLGIRFPLLLDPDRKSPRLFGVWGHPSTVRIDRRGRIVGLVRGERDWQSDAALRLVEYLLNVR